MIIQLSMCKICIRFVFKGCTCDVTNKKFLFSLNYSIFDTLLRNLEPMQKQDSLLKKCHWNSLKVLLLRKY